MDRKNYLEKIYALTRQEIVNKDALLESKHRVRQEYAERHASLNREEAEKMHELICGHRMNQEAINEQKRMLKMEFELSLEADGRE